MSFDPKNLDFSSQRIYLIGYMACGKSSVGHQLADTLNFLHFDTDEAIQSYTGQNINDYFTASGENSFRILEQQILNLSLDLDKIIISTGGGLPCFEENMWKMLSHGLVIFLDAPISVLAQRILSQNNRPLHKADNIETIEKAITKRLGSRITYYNEAHLTINSGAPIDIIAKEIIDKLRDRNSNEIY